MCSLDIRIWYEVPVILVTHIDLTISLPGDMKTRKRTGTICQIEIHFSIKTTEYLLKYTLFRFQIYVRAIVLMTKHDSKISASLIKNNERYNRLYKGKMDFYWNNPF